MTAAASGAAAAPSPVVSAVIAVLVVVGAAFLTVGTVGLLRLPNVYNRLHATSKATTLGASSIALATWAYFGPGGDGLKALVTILFLFLTAPTGAHMISRAAQRMGVEFEPQVRWPGAADEQVEEPADD
ncbi:monovalent cation/H(+) antiporter subunit G [Halobaculum sp. D14]|uniref:monovalent cation/H(+) antiporter subunit G n=1 Tax=unclassified Halobaculum TaxID=2640896 RepID=UPI003EBE61E0